MRNRVCSCGGTMQNIGQTKLQEGKFSLLWGHLGHVLSGALTVDIDCCETCKKLAFYLIDEMPEGAQSGIAQIPCTGCGVMHDMDDAICPHCGKRLMD